MAEDNEDNKQNAAPTTLIGIAGVAVKWVTGQTFNNVLLVLILASVIGGTCYAFKWAEKAIPEHIAAIQGGYEKNETQQTGQLKDQQQTFEKVTSMQQASYEKLASSQQASFERIMELVTEKGVTRKSATASLPVAPAGEGQN